MTKYIYFFYILLGVCLLAGFGSAFGSGQEHDVVRTVDLENSAVALCNISESNNGQEKKEINNESYHFYKVGIGGAATSFSFRLKRAGINTVEDLCAKTMDDLMKVRNMGRKSLDEILNKLESMGHLYCFLLTY